MDRQDHRFIHSLLKTYIFVMAAAGGDSASMDVKDVPTASESVLKALELDRWGVSAAGAEVYHNLSHEHIRAHMMARKEGVTIDNGTMVVDTGETTIYLGIRVHLHLSRIPRSDSLEMRSQYLLL